MGSVFCPTPSCVFGRGHEGMCANADGFLLTGRVLKYGPSGQQYEGPRQRIVVEKQPSLAVAIWRLWRDRRRHRRQLVS